MLTSKQAVLILGEPDEVHIASVCQHLSQMKVIIVDAWQPWQPMSVVYEHNNHQVFADGSPLTFIGVWNRLKPRLGSGFTEAETFALRERREYLYALVSLSEAPNQINDPCKQEWGRNKLIQLAQAQNIGLSIPATFASNDAEYIAEKASMYENKIVYKTLTWLASIDGKLLFTNLVNRTKILEHHSAIRLAPGIYQELVPKSCEYRVTIIDDEIFAARIYSQEREDTTLDWRRNQDDVRYESCKLPSLIESKLMILMGCCGLRYGAIDLIETPNEEFVFLEINPAGNWLWLEEKLNLPISRAIASALCKSS